jgi:hypothetical protein
MLITITNTTNTTNKHNTLSPIANDDEKAYGQIRLERGISMLM